MAPGVPSLFHISQAVCIKQASRITDVGDTPYHLVQPVLKRLNAKQLALLEENSPVVVPHSDELWGSLMEKDFPDRPYNPAKLRLLPAGDHAHMPRRALYRQYSNEREQFLSTSADRLRKMTERLRKQKSKNSITSVEGLLPDPTIRRRAPQYSASRSYTQKPRPKTILGKAMRDVLQRLLMFGGTRKAYDPYRPFQTHQQPPINISSRARAPILSPSRPTAHTCAVMLPRASLGKGTELHSCSRSPTTISDASLSFESSSEQTETAGRDTRPIEEAYGQPQLRKRKPPPSIFLNHRKKQRIGQAKLAGGPSAKKTNKDTSEEQAQDSKPIRAIKSSIFH